MTSPQLLRSKKLWCVPALLAAVVTVGQMSRADDGRNSAGPAGGPSAPNAAVYGISKPSKELKLSFAAPGLIATVNVERGDHVKAGQVLAAQDDSQDQLALKSMQLESKSIAKIDYSKTDKAEKVVKRDRTKTMFDKHVATQSEFEDSQLAVELAQAQIELAEVEHGQKQLDADKEQDKIDKMKMKSPIDGVIKKLNIGPGEMADPQNREGSIVIAKWDPLWIDWNPDSADARDLKVDQVLKVQYEGAKPDEWLDAKIIFLDQYDAASGSRLVELSLPNPTEIPPGLRFIVKLPDKTAAATAVNH